MGLFGKKKKNEEVVNQPVQTQEYFQPVEELEFGIPVGNVQPIEPEIPKPEIIFSDFEQPTIDNSAKITANNEYIVAPTDISALLGTGLSSNNDYDVNQENNNNFHEFIPLENDNQYQETNLTEEDYDSSNRSFRFFENDSSDYKLSKQKEEVTPIVGTTNIFNIGKVEVSTSYKECPACNQKVDENADVCRNCGYSFGRVR